MPPRSSDATSDGPLRLNTAARRLGYDRRTLLRYATQLGIYRLGREWRVPAATVLAVQSGHQSIPPTPETPCPPTT